MELFLTAAASFLGGSLLTALVFVFTFSNKVTAMNTTLTNLSVRFDQHLVSPPICPFHQKLSEEVAILHSESKRISAEGIK